MDNAIFLKTHQIICKNTKLYLFLIHFFLQDALLYSIFLCQNFVLMSIQLPPYRPVKRRSGLQVMLASIHALLMRELQTRFGGYLLGYLWAPLEIIFQVAIYVIIFGTVMKRVLPGMEYPLFLLSGMIPFYMFQKNATRALGAVEANQGLLMYRSVQHIDVILARSFLEFLIYFFTFWLLMGML